jgi:hypothetical protein
MAEIAKSGVPSLSSLTTDVNKLSGLLAGEALAAGDACYIKDTDGKVYKSTGAAANAAAKVRGFAAQATPINEAVTLYWDVRFNYGAALTPGANVFLSGATPGGLADAASTGGTASIGFVVDATRIHLMLSRY